MISLQIILGLLVCICLESSFQMTTNFRIYMVTWNVAESSPPTDFIRLFGLDARVLPNLYAVGLQELKSSAMSMLSDAVYDDAWTTAITNVLSTRDYVRVRTNRLVGIHLAVYIRRADLPYVSNIESDYTRTGLKGFWGSKGTVSIRMDVHGINLCILNSHLSAHLENYAQRIEDYTQALLSQKFKDENSTSILDHDYVFWMGDFNFRIDGLANELVRKAAAAGDFSSLWKYDQLNKARKEQFIFIDFEEGSLNFPPTYKYDQETDRYDSSAKNRVPSWCDRILSFVHEDSYEGVTLSIDQLDYSSIMEYRNSDHKPVISTFDIQVLKYPPELPVMFEPISTWNRNSDKEIMYTIPRSLPFQSRDWIGLYKNGFKHFDDYVAFIWASTRKDTMADGTLSFTVTIDGKLIGRLEPDSSYCLLYHSAIKDCVVGYSDSFRITDKEESSSSSEDEETRPVPRGRPVHSSHRQMRPSHSDLPSSESDIDPVDNDKDTVGKRQDWSPVLGKSKEFDIDNLKQKSIHKEANEVSLKFDEDCQNTDEGFHSIDQPAKKLGNFMELKNMESREPGELQLTSTAPVELQTDSRKDDELQMKIREPYDHQMESREPEELHKSLKEINQVSSSNLECENEESIQKSLLSPLSTVYGADLLVTNDEANCFLTHSESPLMVAMEKDESSSKETRDEQDSSLCKNMEQLRLDDDTLEGERGLEETNQFPSQGLNPTVENHQETKDDKVIESPLHVFNPTVEDQKTNEGKEIFENLVHDLNPTVEAERNGGKEVFENLVHDLNPTVEAERNGGKEVFEHLVHDSNPTDTIQDKNIDTSECQENEHVEEILDSKEDGKILDFKDDAEILDSKVNEEILDSKDNAEILNSKDNAEILNSKDNAEILNSKDSAKIWNFKDNAEIRNSKDNEEFKIIQSQGQSLIEDIDSQGRDLSGKNPAQKQNENIENEIEGEKFPGLDGKVEEAKELTSTPLDVIGSQEIPNPDNGAYERSEVPNSMTDHKFDDAPISDVVSTSENELPRSSNLNDSAFKDDTTN